MSGARTCTDCGAQWHGETLLWAPGEQRNGGRVLVCDTCGFNADRHQPVIWEDGEAAE